MECFKCHDHIFDHISMTDFYSIVLLMAVGWCGKTSLVVDGRISFRHLSLDLTGLPSTSAEVEAFVRDPDPLAWQCLGMVPHYGAH